MGSINCTQHYSYVSSSQFKSKEHEKMKYSLGKTLKEKYLQRVFAVVTKKRTTTAQVRAL